MFETVTIEQIGAFAGIWFAAAASPGGNTAFTVAISSRYGLVAGLVGALGFVTIMLFYLFATAIGLDLVVSRHTQVLSYVKWVGVLYLLYLGYRMWTAAPTVENGKKFEECSYPKIYMLGALICLSNPKVLLFAIGVLPQLIDTSSSITDQLTVFAIVGGLLSFLAHTIYSILGYTIGNSVPTPRAKLICNRIIGTIFVLAAIGLGMANI